MTTLTCDIKCQDRAEMILVALPGLLRLRQRPHWNEHCVPIALAAILQLPTPPGGERERESERNVRNARKKSQRIKITACACLGENMGKRRVIGGEAGGGGEEGGLKQARVRLAVLSNNATNCQAAGGNESRVGPFK